jgi:hypothetical protein
MALQLIEILVAVVSLAALVVWVWRSRNPTPVSPGPFFVSSLLAPFEPPKVPGVGDSANAIFRIALPSTVEEPRVTVTLATIMGDYRVALPRDVLERIAHEAPKPELLLPGALQRLTDSDAAAVRFASTAAHSAQFLLAEPRRVVVETSVFGRELGPELVLVETLLTAAKASVRDPAGEVASELQIVFSGSRPGPMMGHGRICYRVQFPTRAVGPPAAGEELFSRPWFVC